MPTKSYLVRARLAGEDSHVRDARLGLDGLRPAYSQDEKLGFQYSNSLGSKTTRWDKPVNSVKQLACVY